MNVHDYRFLLAEQATLNRLIGEISESDIISRISLQARLGAVEAQLADYHGSSARLRTARLTFKGDPVLGGRGILMDFVSDASKAFANAITVVGSSLTATVAPTGRVPNAEQFQLAITGIAYGSFGFQIEEASPQLSFDDMATPVEMAISKVKGILSATIGTDDDLSEAIADTDSRALSALQQFLKRVADGGAAFTLAHDGDAFDFVDAAQVRRSEARLSADNIRENDTMISVRFMGFFPFRPRAQFIIVAADAEYLSDEVGQIATARVDTSVAEQVDINAILNQDQQITVHTRRVGTSRPRYTVTGFARDPGAQLTFDQISK
ncbi:MAG: hypothetical protein OXL37_13005 [Chloroflexota bacterium]|nr:hypothetical protein [Chloroflexota bacterium]MDE2959175.1 hypothetical protein [Chloroflexota bacterium]